jgi:uncharacterized membrane protein YcaP (DUF421 family)
VKIFFTSWGDILHVVLATAIIFMFVVAILRVVGPQALAKMSGYDMVATVTFGSIVSTVAVTRGITITAGLAAVLTLIGLQEILRILQSRWMAAHHAVRQTPQVVLWDGRLLEDRLREARVSADEVRAAVRKMGMSSLAEARIVVLENDGDWSVIPCKDERGDESALFGLAIPGRPDNSPDKDGAKARPAPADRLP